MKITSLLLAVVCLLAIVSARPANDNEYDDEPAPAPKSPVRGNPLLRRNPLNGRNAKTTTTTTTQAPKEEEEENYDELEEEEPKPITTTTEAPKKLRGGILRPFRSNDDLLAALKRRREQATIGKSHAAKVQHEENHDADPTPAPKRVNNNANNAGRRKFNTAQKTEESQQDSESVAPPARSGRRFSSRA